MPGLALWQERKASGRAANPGQNRTAKFALSPVMTVGNTDTRKRRNPLPPPNWQRFKGCIHMKSLLTIVLSAIIPGAVARTADVKVGRFVKKKTGRMRLLIPSIVPVLLLLALYVVANLLGILDGSENPINIP
jgi:hypothetical protein